MNYYFPVALIAISVTLYNISQKSAPAKADPYFVLIVAYVVALLLSIFLFFMNGGDKNIINSFKHINWTTYLLGITLVGIELGYLLLYRAGWNINIGPLVINIIIAVALVFVGMLLYKESLSLNQILGMGICIIGLIVINR